MAVFFNILNIIITTIIIITTSRYKDGEDGVIETESKVRGSCVSDQY